MDNLMPLVKREWIQHRFAWALMLLLPLALVLVVASFGTVRIDDPDIERMPGVLAFAAMGGGMGVTLVVMLIGSLILMAGLGRRDHADRSNEFWLSLPIGHAESYAIPLLVHLLVLPAVAVLVGLTAGFIVSMPLVARTTGWAEWLALPWGVILPALLAVAARLMAGLPLALLWLSPIVLVLVLLSAWVGRWGIVIMAAGVGVGSGVLDLLLGQPWPALVLGRVMQGAGQALIGASQTNMVIENDSGFSRFLEAMTLVRGWAWNDFVAALGQLASPVLAGALAVAALCFWLLVQWRRRGI